MVLDGKPSIVCIYDMDLNIIFVHVEADSLFTILTELSDI